MLDHKLQHICEFVILTTAFSILTQCTPRVAHYESGTLESARVYYSMPEAIPELPEDVKERKEEKELDRYRAILEQKFQFSPPVAIVLIVPPPPIYYYWPRRSYPMHLDSINVMLFDALSEKLTKSEYVKELKLPPSFFGYGTLNKMREIAARHQADELLLISYDLRIQQPTSCLGLWPATYKLADLNSEMMLVDTRTGFFLTGKRYYVTKKRSLGSSKELEFIRLIVDDWTDSIVTDIVEFYSAVSR
ncbi:hypothetical protein AMJ74_02175 [candidate division WOR_3 bacterium SM1_77]|uniref:Lipoprotein n=1 Tax=candidate division WOR_3 bacterium SM1_77 TaxID=1703778 RepID=A0A0S8JYZ6_UNCW3|nr:MAG: hypothetical protein AMJ74_02175 [candidate division WOR_3 bacterium SM1_77]